MGLIYGRFPPVKTKLLSLSLLALLVSCLPSMDKSALNFKEHALPELKPEVITEVTFELLKTQVLEPKCLGCHAKWNDEAAFQEKYITFGKPEESKLYESVRLARMPKGKKLPDGTRSPVIPLTTAELELIYNYITHAKGIL